MVPTEEKCITFVGFKFLDKCNDLVMFFGQVNNVWPHLTALNGDY